MLGSRAVAAAAMAEVRGVVGELRIGRRELFDGLPSKNLAHEAAVHAVAGNRGRHLHFIAAANPNRRGKLRGNAAEPFIAPVLGRTRFAGNGLSVADSRATASAVGHNAFHNVGCRLGKRRIKHLFSLGVGLVDGGAVRVLDGFDAHGFALGAAIGNGRIGLSHLAHRHLFRTQGDGRISVEVGLDAALLRHIGHLLRADLGAQLGKARVRRNREGALDGTRTVVGAAVVLYLPAVDVHMARAVEVRVRRHAVVQRGQQRERLEGGARLALRLRCQIELVGVVIASADERLDVTRIRVYRNHGKLQVAGKRFQLGLGRLLGSILHLRVERGHDRHAALEHFVGGVFLQKRFAHVAGEILVLVHAIARAYGGNVEVQVFRLGRIVLFLGNNAVGKHAVKHQVAAILAILGVVDRVVVCRRLGNADKRCRLGDGKVLRILGVIALRCRLDAVGALTVVNGVQVHLKDLVFRVGFLQLNGDIRFANLALQGRFRGLISQNGISHELLRNSGSTLVAGMRNVHPHSTGNTHEVDAVMLVEAFVLRGNGALGNVGAHIFQIDWVTVLKIELGEQRRPVVRVHLGLLCVIVCRSVVVVGQILQPNRAQGNYRNAAGNQCAHNHCAHNAKPQARFPLASAMLASSSS